MGELNEQPRTPNLYEDMSPEVRFVYVVNALVDRVGESDNDNESVRYTSWPVRPKGHHYRLRKAMVYNIWQYPEFIYSLEHFIDDLPTDKPMTRYSVTFSGSNISAVSFIDAEGKHRALNNETRREAMRQMLGILEEVSPEDAKDALTMVFNRKFENTAGIYVLSDLALEGNTEELSEFVAWDLTESQNEIVEIIHDEVLEESKEHDSPAKQSFIQEAIDTRRGPTNKNSYKPVDVLAGAERVAKEIGKKWKYTVTYDQ